MNWSTFVFEILNFLVLLWVLQRFLYKPVLGVVERRRAAVEGSLAEAESARAEAEALKRQYEGRLGDWERERERARAELAAELEAERGRALARLEAELERTREKARASAERRDDDARRAAEETALAQASRFAARLLERAAGPDVEARLVEALIADVAALPPERLAALRAELGPKAPHEIVAVTAFALAPETRAALERALRTATGLDVPVRHEQDASLLAGVRVTIGSLRLSADLGDELEAFAELAHAG